jgi:L-malate glycosyltransferase
MTPHLQNEIDSQPSMPLVSSRKPGAAFAANVFMMINSFEIGGTEHQFLELTKSLDQSAFSLHLGCLQAGGKWQEGMQDVSEFPVGGSLYKPKSLRTRWKLAQHLREHEITVAQAFDFYTNLTLIPAARLARIPAIIGSQRQVGDLLTVAQFRVQCAAFKWCDKVVCNSRAAKGRLVEYGMADDKLTVIGNGLPGSAFVRAEPLLPPRRNVLRVGMIARMNAEYKNHRTFLTAIARLSRSFPQVAFILVGDGPLRPGLTSLAEELGLGSSVQFLGDRHDIPAVLASLDVSVVPSISESLSNAVLESMAAGVPVIASDVGGNPELIGGDRGVLVPASDAIALSSALQRLLENRDLRMELANNARKFVERNFTIEQIAGKYEKLYIETLERKNWQRKRRPQPRPADRPLRVAIVAPSLRYVGGQAVQAELLRHHWAGDSEVEARFIPVDPTFPRFLRWTEKIPGVRTIIREPIYLMALWRDLKHADVAHLFSASYWSFLLAPAVAHAVARLRGKSTIVNYRSGEARDHLRRFRSARSILAKADCLVVPSGYLADVFREFDLTVRVVPNMIEFSLFSYRRRKPLRPRLLCTRGFHPYYRVDLVVRAFAQVQAEFPDARLELVGGGPLEKTIRDLVAQLGIQGVRFSGVAGRQEIGRFYDAADIFINASALDNMPVSILEAFASGTPVVSTNPEGMRYVIEHERTGLLSEPGDASALAQNVIRLLKDEEMSCRIARNAYEETRHYRWSAVRQQWLDIYRSLCGQQQKASGGLVSVAK